MTRVIPDGPFVEVPYKLLQCWTAGGFTWDELIMAEGIPAAVWARLTVANRGWCSKVVRVHRQATDEQRAAGCPVGRAWLGPGTTLPVRLITGVMTPPAVVGPRRKFRW